MCIQAIHYYKVTHCLAKKAICLPILLLIVFPETNIWHTRQLYSFASTLQVFSLHHQWLYPFWQPLLSLHWPPLRKEWAFFLESTWPWPMRPIHQLYLVFWWYSIVVWDKWPHKLFYWVNSSAKQSISKNGMFSKVLSWDYLRSVSRYFRYFFKNCPFLSSRGNVTICNLQKTAHLQKWYNALLKM